MGHRSDIELARTGLGTITQDLGNLTDRVEELEMGTSLALRYDQDADPPTVAYLGQAVPGTSTGASGWRVQKLVFNAQGDVTCTWADGNANFDNVWDDRTSLTYS